MDATPRARVGTRFAGRYDLLAVLGEGGMGTVYRARHAFTGAEVALKIMHSTVARSKNAKERFLREAQAPSAIGHPGIVKVPDAGVAEDGTLYLALELLDGEDLGAAVARGAVDVKALVAITIDLLDALSAAHASGLIHRDIKPENVFLSRDASGVSKVHLLDFGITRQVNDTADEKLTQTGTILGTPHYMSPEQARGQPVDARSDIYAVGGMMFYALTGRPPFQAANYNLLIVAIMTNPAPLLRTVRPEIPADLAAVIDSALSSAVTARFDSAAAMRAALQSCASVDLPAVRDSSGVAYDPTMASESGLPRTNASTPIQHPVPAPLAPGATTGPQDARTPRPGSPSGGVPATKGASAVAPVESAPKKSKMPLISVLVVILGALSGGVIAAVTLIEGDEAEVPDAQPPAVVTTTDLPVLPPGADAAAMEPSSGLEARLAELEAQAAEAEARAQAMEREREEEAQARNVAQKRAAMRRAERLAEEAAAMNAAAARCQLDCSVESGRCQREGGGRGQAALECHQAWTRCSRSCRR